MEQETARHNWGINLLIATSVVVTVFMALLMSQLDTLRTRLVIEPTVIAFVTQPILTATSVPTTPLPTVTATAVPPSPMPTADVTVAATAVPMLPVCGDIPAGWVPYIVRPGDSYFFLSANSGATIAEIIQANCLDGNVLLSGIQIYLPAQPPVRPVCGPPATWERYVVQAGDTLFSLAQRRGTTVYAVMQANCLSSSYLFAGRQIYLPPLPVTATPIPTVTPIPTTPPPPTATPTATPPLPTATHTTSPTPSLVPSETATAVPSATATPTLPPATATATATATQSPTATATIDATDTPTPTPTPSATATSTPTPSPSPTATETPKPTETPTPTPTATAVPTDTPTPEPEPTITPTNTLEPAP